MILNSEPMDIEGIKGMLGVEPTAEMSTSLITEPTQENFLECVKSNPSYLQFFQDKMTLASLVKVVQFNGMHIQHIKDPPYEVVLEAVRNNHLAIQFIPSSKISEEVCLEVVKKDGTFVRFINDPTDSIILTAIRQNANSLGLIKNKVITEEMCIEAVKTDPFFIKNITNPTPNVLFEAVKRDWRSAEFFTFEKKSPEQGGAAEQFV